MVPYAAESSVGFVDPGLAKTRRRIMAAVFSRRAVVAMEHLVQRKVRFYHLPGHDLFIDPLPPGR